MNVLEILEDIKEAEKKFVVGHEVLFALGATSMATMIAEIIRSHMDDGKDIPHTCDTCRRYGRSDHNCYYCKWKPRQDMWEPKEACHG